MDVKKQKKKTVLLIPHVLFVFVIVQSTAVAYPGVFGTVGQLGQRETTRVGNEQLNPETVGDSSGLFRVCVPKIFLIYVQNAKHVYKLA